MKKRIVVNLWRGERRRLEHRAKKTKEAQLRTRIQIVLHYAQGWGCTRIAKALNIVPSHAIKTAHRFLEYGEDGLEDRRKENGITKADDDVCQALSELLETCPQDHGWSRPTWTRELLAKVLEQEAGVRVCVTTISSMLNKLGARWGMARATVFCPWSKRRKTRRIRQILKMIKKLPGNEKAFYQDEVDIHLNPKIGRDWMLAGRQTIVVTPGKNEKRYIAGALAFDGGDLIFVSGDRKKTALFIALLKKLQQKHPDARRIHLILDNYSIHSSKILQRYLARQDGLFVLHFLPPYCPNANKIERFWRDLHANVTRNHRCGTMDELMKEVRRYLNAVARKRRRHSRAARPRKTKKKAA